VASAVDSRQALIPAPRRPPDRFRTLTAVVASTAPVLLAVIVAILFQQASPAVKHYGLAFLTGIDWNPVTESFGALPAIFGTVATALESELRAQASSR